MGLEPGWNTMEGAKHWNSRWTDRFARSPDSKHLFSSNSDGLYKSSWYLLTVGLDGKSWDDLTLAGQKWCMFLIKQRSLEQQLQEDTYLFGLDVMVSGQR